MTIDQYIPTGRTSLIKQGKVHLQVQTEYANRPKPRITTTIIDSGQVVHKIERNLDNPIISEEQQLKVERTIVRQHQEIVALIRQRSEQKTKTNRSQPQPSPVTEAKSGPQLPGSGSDSTESPSNRSASEIEQAPPLYQELPDQLMCLPGVRQVYRLTNDGEFVDSGTRSQFKKEHRKILKNLADLMELYGRVPGAVKREAGVYEIERDRLYFASSGLECYFIYIERPRVNYIYEKAIKDIVYGN